MHNSPKPTDSGQLRNDINKVVVEVCGQPDGNPSSIATFRELVTSLMMYIQERDQQQLSAALVALPPSTAATSVRDLKYIAAIKTALGPDNSKIEE